MHRLFRLIQLALRQWPLLTGILVLSVGSSAVAALQPWPIKILVDYALGAAGTPDALRSLLEGLSLEITPTLLIFVAATASLGLFALSSVIDTALSWAAASAGQAMTYDLATRLFHRLQRLSLSFHRRHSVGDSLSRLSGDTWSLYAVADAVLVSPWQHGLKLVTVSVVAWSLDPQLTVLSLALAPVLAGFAVFFGPRLKRRSLQDREAQSRLFSFVHQTLEAIPMVQAFGAEGRNRRRFGHLAADAVVVSQRGVFVRSTYSLLIGLGTTAGTAAILVVGSLRVLSGALTVGSLLVFLAYLQTMHGAFQGLLSLYARLRSVGASVDRVLEIFEVEEGVRDAPGAQPVPARPVGERGHVRLEGVRFGYEPGRVVLEGVSLEARPGETLALVGPTGAGKSTLVSLIPRFFDPWEGRVLLDGVDVRGVQLASLRAQVALVLQEPLLLPLSIADNIAYGRPGANREAIVAAAEAANADAFIRRLPQGYDTRIGERGATLSGGEKQRLAIARALLKDAPVLILDEPTSALDAETEGQLLEALERLMQGRTTFLIAHRLSTVRAADRIVVLLEGRVVEEGSPAELAVRDGLYARFHRLQLQPQHTIGGPPGGRAPSRAWAQAGREDR